MEWVGFSLIFLVVLEMALLFRKSEMLNAPVPSAQFWIQDLLIAIVSYGAFLFIFKPSTEDDSGTIRLLFAALLPIAGFVCAMDVFSRYPKLGQQTVMRALIMFLLLSVFTFGWQISFLTWWLIQCVNGCRVERAMNSGLRLFLLLVLTAYGAAFFLPVDLAMSTPFLGYSAYAACWDEMTKKLAMLPDELAGQLWLANPMFWLSISFSADRRWLMALSAAGVALLIGLSISLEPPFTLYQSPGYVLWIGSMAAIAGHAVVRLVSAPVTMPTS